VLADISVEAVGGVIAGVVMSAIVTVGGLALAVWRAWPTISKGWALLNRSAASAEGSEKQLARLGGSSLAESCRSSADGEPSSGGSTGVFKAIVVEVIKEELDSRLETSVKRAVHAELGPVRLAIESINSAVTGLSHSVTATQRSVEHHADIAARRSRDLSDRISADTSTTGGTTPG
jgi:hypothetical protein